MYEKISDIYEFVQSCLADETLDFNLVSASEGKFSEDDMEKTLYDCKYVSQKNPSYTKLINNVMYFLLLFSFLVQTHPKYSSTVCGPSNSNSCSS